MPYAGKFWRSAYGLVVGTTGFLLAFFLVHLPHGPEHWSADLRTALLADRLNTQHPRVVIVEVTEETLRQNNYLAPVDREVLSRLVRALDASEASVIGLDFIFDRQTEAAKDQELLEAIRSARARIVLGALDHRTPLSLERMNFQEWLLAAARRPIGHLYYGEHHNPAVISDQVVRHMADPAENPNRKSFAEQIAIESGYYWPPASLYLSWLRPPRDGLQTFLTLSGRDVLGDGLTTPLPLREMLRGKIVLVGGNFSDRDQHLIPFSVLSGEWYPGVFVHAQLVAQLIDQDRRPIHILSWPIWVGVLLSAIVGGFLAGRSERLARHHPWLEIGTIVGFIILSILAFLFGRFIFPFIAVVLGWGWGEMVGSYWRPSGANH